MHNGLGIKLLFLTPEIQNLDKHQITEERGSDDLVGVAASRMVQSNSLLTPTQDCDTFLQSTLIQPCHVDQSIGRFTALLSAGGWWCVSSVNRGFPQCLRLSKNFVRLRLTTSSTPGSCSSSLILQIFFLAGTSSAPSYSLLNQLLPLVVTVTVYALWKCVRCFAWFFEGAVVPTLHQDI